MDTDILIRDYLSRLEVAGASLPVHRRAELAGEVRDHIEAAFSDAGQRDEVTVRNVLERLGSPEEIVAGDAAQARTPDAAGTRSRLGWVEIVAMLLLPLAWVALLTLRFQLEGVNVGFILWLGFGVVGVVLVWISSVWSKRQKLITTGLVVALYVALVVIITPVRQVESPRGSPIVTTQE